MHLGNDKRNSRIAMVAIILFIVFDFAALALNFWLSHKIEQQAIGINLAGRQRMLSQRMVKVLLQIDNARNANLDATARLDELRVTFDLFDNTLQGFDTGHPTRGGANEELFLPAVTGEGARLAVDEATRLWAPYREHIRKVLTAGRPVSAEVLLPALRQAEESNLQLLNLMNRLTTELEIKTKKEASQIRLYQATAFALALANFFWAFVMYMRRIRAFSQSHNLLDDTINKISASVLVLNSHDRVLKANETAEKMFSYGKGELVGKQIDELLQGKDDNLVGQRRDGSTFLAMHERNAAVLDQQELFIVTVLDVTQQRMTEEHLSSLAYHDLLTRLPNRLLFDDRLRLEITHSQRRNLMLAVLFIDLDRFKPVNDTYGHDIGDLLLQDVAVRLRRCLRESDTVSRRGGDEFTIIATDIGTAGHCEKIAQVVLSQIERPFHIQNLELHIGCSIGISIFPTDGDDAHLLVSRADEAMYQAKQAGRGTYRFYFPPASPA